MYIKLRKRHFAIAYENLNRELLYPRWHSQEEIAAADTEYEAEVSEFMNEVDAAFEAAPCKWNACNYLRDWGYHSEVNEALRVAGY